MITLEIIKEKFNELGITEVGIVSAKSQHIEFTAQKSAFGSKAGFSSIDKILENAKSIIVYLVPYFNGIKPKNISMYAAGEDYHFVCKKISSEIGMLLSEHGHKHISFADSGPLTERKLAYKAGLGIIGDNGFLINKKYGSYTFIGYIITDLALPESEIINKQCKKCGACYKACPGNALSKDGFNENKCLSYITQKKAELTEEEKELIKKTGCIWGCDVCQNACPMNKNVEISPLEEFKKNLILCIKNEYLSNKEFKNKYKNRAFTWRGKSVIYRNLSILDDNG